MSDFQFNIAKGTTGYYATLPGASDSLIVVPLQTTGLGSDATLKDDVTLVDVLTHATEQATMGRITLVNVTSAADNVNDLRKVSADNLVWLAASGPSISAVVVCYVPTSGAADSALIPLLKYDALISGVPITPNGGNITLQVPASGLFRAT